MAKKKRKSDKPKGKQRPKRERPATNENAKLKRQLAEARREQVAAAEILKVISRSSNDLRPVLNAIAETAAHLCNADYAFVYKLHADTFHLAASSNANADWVQYVRNHPVSPGRGTVVGRTLQERQTVHVKDVLADLEYTDVQRQRLGNYRTILGVPLLRDQTPIGSIILLRSAVKPFSVAQINLVETFADQAVIAIENVRLFDEVQAKTRDLEESLQQQTATADVLKLISRSVFDLQPVLDGIARVASDLCAANDVSILISDADNLRITAHHGSIPMELGAVRPINRDWVSGRAFLDRKPVHVRDLAVADDFPLGRQVAAKFGHRTTLAIPLLRDDEAVGCMLLRRLIVQDFTAEQIELLRTFADQAVIAIENARLFNETQEALERQTATADILKVIASSPSDLQPLFDAIAERSNRLVGGHSVTVQRFVNDTAVLAAFTPTSAEADAALKSSFPRKLKDYPQIALAHGGDGVVVADTETESQIPASIRELARSRGFRSMLLTPLMGDGGAIGMISVTRKEPGTFALNHVQLLQTFADQAVIAIENVRLFDEVQAKTRDLSEALTYQTGSSNILSVIASSPTDVGPVLKAIADSACELCDAYDAIVLLKDGEDLRFSAHHGPIPLKSEKLPINRNWITGRAVVDKVPIHVKDLLSSEGDQFPQSRERLQQEGHRTVLCVPMLRDGESIGAIALRRLEVHPFSEKQIVLLQTFANQAVIAIGNVRMFEQVQQRTKELSLSLDNLRTAQDRLVQTEKLASLGQLTAGIAHEIKNPLNFVNNFSALSVELTDELNDVLRKATLADKIRAEVDELTSLLKDNLAKVVQHGKRADSIVKNMLLHSREGSGERRSADINALVGESLNLAYHGARAEKAGFEIALQHDFDPEAGTLDLYPQEITRALLNLISNGFYAAARRKAEAGKETFVPVLSAATRNLGETVEIRIRDNGAGIPPDVREKMFNPFFTTKPTGEGTGLGLSMTHDIVVKQHGGRIDVETEPGAFTEFIITLPRGNGNTDRPKSE